MTEKTYVDAIHDALFEEMERIETMIVLGEDIQEGGVFRVTDGMFERFGGMRVLDTPLAESSIVGVAIDDPNEVERQSCEGFSGHGGVGIRPTLDGRGERRDSGCSVITKRPPNVFGCVLHYRARPESS